MLCYVTIYIQRYIIMIKYNYTEELCYVSIRRYTDITILYYIIKWKLWKFSKIYIITNNNNNIGIVT